ncbi:MAG: AAA family ATPase [bacterium]|nr:AAA family ATPase [bacterium]
MKIKSVFVKNFRGIGNYMLTCKFKDFNLLIGDNGTSKTAILEAINLCLSSSYASSRLSLEDFYCGGNNDIEISTIFENSFDVDIPDLYGNTQKIKCNGISLTAKKRDRSAPGKAFNDLVVAEHYFLPEEPRGDQGWTIKRKNESILKITERQLSLTYASAEYPRSFYFGKNRDRQLQKGYNSSFTNIIDDLNWRFEKSERTKIETDKFKHKREEIEKHIFENTDGDTLGKTIEQTNKILKDFDIPAIDLSVVKTLTPYDNSEMVKRFDGFELPVNLIGSGIEMITALIFLETLAKISKNEICIIIDEPELHLHPTLQDKFAKHLEDISQESQVFISTHSPFFFKNCFDHPNNKTLIFEIDGDKLSITDAKDKGFGLLKWSPSWGEICYFAYNLPTTEFHDDLYSSIEDYLKTSPSQKISQDDTENWFILKSQTKEIKWINSSGITIEETLMTYIRNRIHHGDNQNRPMYSSGQLKDSIERMINLIK